MEPLLWKFLNETCPMHVVGNERKIDVDCIDFICSVHRCMLAMKMIFHEDILADPDVLAVDACGFLDRWMNSTRSLIDAQVYMLPFIEKLAEEVSKRTELLLSVYATNDAE